MLTLPEGDDPRPAVTDPIIVIGRLGWRNSGGEDNMTQLRAYGPGGRWAKPAGDGIENALVREGAIEGTRLIVVALHPSTGDERVDDLAAIFGWGPATSVDRVGKVVKALLGDAHLR